MITGIVADNYKVPLFEQELKAAGLAFNESPFTKSTTVIQVTCREDQLVQVRDICFRVESTARQNKQREN